MLLHCYYHLYAENKEGSFTMFTPSQISEIEGDLTQFSSPDVADCGVK
jgi:hypothetical protein